MIKIPFDPLQRAKKVEEIVCANKKRKYYRFRYSKYYNGIATADAVGCCFLCAYCWNYFRNLKPEKFGKFYSSEEVSKNLLKIALRKGCLRFRISGAEPILGKTSFEHLIEILKKISKELKKFEFIIETNGFILGYYIDLVEKLVKFKKFLMVRVSIKGWDEKSFEKITGCSGKYFEYPLIALKNLLEKGINAWPAIMFEIFKGKGTEILVEKLKKFGIRSEELEIEYLEAYPFVLENLEKRGIKINL